MEIHQIPEQLPLIKHSKDLWGSFAYSKCKDAYGYDKNGLKRYALIVQLQYDQTVTEADKEFLHYLMRQEIEMHKSHPYQGLHESMDIVAFLLAKCKDVNHIPLFEQAKLSNFDTYYGFDTEYIISAGIEEAITYIEENALYRISSFFQDKKEELETMYTAEHMERWFQSKARIYPAKREDESLITLMDRASDFGNMAEAKKLLEKLEEQLGSDKKNYSLLYHQAKRLEEYDKALHYLTQNFPEQEDSFDKVSHWLKIAEIHLLKQDWVQAFASVKQCEPELKLFTSWRSAGLGRSLSETLLDISLKARDSDEVLAREAYRWADQMLKSTNNSNSNVLRKAHQCAKVLQLKQDKRLYSKKVAIEARRINRMFR
ncbi:MULTISPECIES: hypothetical protein [Brevibacillus]|uniref:Uncharacterized protein n=1 Tax=Brevibacillus brevis TaxID=1393 RepID=A0A2Z4MPI9_BREBE|nr:MULTISPECIES: hypothetical protein [Brevibacillus]AWX58450.1 hypothetical protein AB432_026915 [Brevibacillus brevis]NRR22260.1 hypothetical protein [Brevibacillus sp. MS2.2]